MNVAILVLDTGYFGAPSAPNIWIQKRDFCRAQPGIPGIVPPYAPRPDGSDSIRGSGTSSCDELAKLLSPSDFRIFSVKCGDSSPPLSGVSPGALHDSLTWSSQLKHAYPTWSWVCYLNFDATAVFGTYPYAPALSAAGIPLIVPVGLHGINLDLNNLNVDMHLNIMTIALDNHSSDYGVISVSLAAPTYMTAVAAVAKARFQHPDLSALDIINTVKSIVRIDPWWTSRSESGGVLSS